ncbi:isoleucine--tRNA ligase, partial [Candidatus Aminicenantes bacterium AH-873-B07]|nr:isoleucine--tRNA ligase [Candidatus Aminicenantes bacterium AH-873-B07]
MEGFKSPYLPGWDCHGLPIEIKVDQLLGEKKKELSIIQFREECRKYAEKYIYIQREDFKRLGVLGEWEEPYLTMSPQYEGDVIRHLASFFASGNIYRKKKPVLWCIHCKTALAEAEIEYKDHTSPSIYVKFPLISDIGKKFPALKDKKVSVIIWTTTPWTLPANLAIAFHPDYEYSAFQVNSEVYIAAKRLIPIVTEALKIPKYKILVTFKGKELKGLKAKHPFLDRESLLLLANFVSLDQGTGCVHSAPGHGEEDYEMGLSYNLDIFAPVNEEGKFTSEISKYEGIQVFEANPLIIQEMKENGTLLSEEVIKHSYPHCWRCKNPVIFRATEQWFISIDKNNLRKKALEAIENVKWIPEWGKERIYNMMVSRPDWCISRQRIWGVPIPAFYCKKCGTILANEKIALKVANVFSKYGSNSWYELPVKEFLPPGTKCPKCGSENFTKENNILDVWFESGASHSVLGKRDDLPWPSDVYVEGHDQYRGWFNSSLIVGLGAKGAPPYREVITHGFVLDEQGRGMSKSLGNVIEPQEIIKENGAEILRLWVAMLNYKEDARLGPEILQRLIEAYRKIRNTWRFILGNLYDFLPEKHMIPKENLLEIDRWVLEKTNKIGKRILKAYKDYEYHIVFHTIYNFFTVDLSAFYLDVLKDRLYCSYPNSHLRRSAQTALFYILKNTLLLIAPILPFTAEEAWENMCEFKEKEESIHLCLFPKFEEKWLSPEEEKNWEKLLSLRDKVLKELEKARESDLIGNSLEAKINLTLPSSDSSFYEKYYSDLPSLFIVSQVNIDFWEKNDVKINIVRAEGEKCERCWNYSPEVGKDKNFPTFCPRCIQVLKKLKIKNLK